MSNENERPYGIIYVAINTITGKFYVGKTTMLLKRRKATHLWHGQKPSTSRFHNSILKHGPDAFSWFVVDYADTEEDLSFKEEQWMWKTNSLHPKFGYNLCTESLGGIKGRKRPKEFGENISRMKKGIPRSEECKRKIGDGNRGKKCSEEAKRKMSQANTGRKMTQDDIAKWKKSRLAGAGFVITEENKVKACAVLKAYSESHPLTPELSAKWRRIRRTKQGKPIVCLDTLEVFDSLASVAEIYSTNSSRYSGLVACLKKPNRTYKGFRWAYVEEYNKTHPDAPLALSSS